jgi:hypothetical protein
MTFSRRRFLQTSLAAALPGLSALADGAGGAFSFLLLGDLHFDRLDHHDFKWLEAHQAAPFRV